MWKPEQDNESQLWHVVNEDGDKLANVTGSRTLAFVHRLDAQAVADSRNAQHAAKAKAEQRATETPQAPATSKKKKTQPQPTQE